MRRLNASGSIPASPSACSFFSSAAVGLPAASRPTEAGMSFTSSARDSEAARTCRNPIARRRGVANSSASRGRR
jgi:hypothetical protein